MKLKLDYDICMAAGQDAGDKNMRKNGRKSWNRSDWNIASEVTNKLLKQQKHHYNIVYH
ncbi:MAG: hypothetical protein NWE89_11765 [Candidatus Bathyarchaeota archaeon]|nr:hypothetical protein [Candidatus Bathyarchaeota archaeon]